VLNVVEIDPQERIAAQVLFDPNDIENIAAAFSELDARYLAGEAAAYAQTWSLVAAAFAAINRHELPELTPDWVNVDHRHGAAFAAGDMTAYLHELFDDVPDIHVYAEVVHRLGKLGAVVTQAGHGTSQEGFRAEWREIGIVVFDGDRLSRYELFDETDLDAALARFDELQPQTPRLENAASRVHSRLKAHVAARDWNSVAELLAEDIAIDDRRQTVNSGIQYGRDTAIADMRGAIDMGLTNISLTVIATRGVRLELCHMSISDDRPDAFRIEFLSVVEINADERIVARVAFDLDDIDAAFQELDARYLAGEAAACCHAWSVITKSYAATNRHELPPTTPDWENADHRRAIGFAPGDLQAYLHATFDNFLPDIHVYIEVVHRLSSIGAVVTRFARGTSGDGFEAEWREIGLSTVRGDLINRSEMFDEEDLDIALARFDELNQPTS
jgi:hypothetical protein